MKTFALLLFAVTVSGQVIDAGSSTDHFFSGGRIWQPSTPGYVPMGAPPWDTLRYDPAFTYTVPVPNGFYVVELGFMEPTKTGPGQRIMSVAINGVSAPAFDLFALVGLRMQYTLKLYAVVNNGTLRLDFKGQVSNGVQQNAVVSAITVRPLALSDLVPGNVEGGSVILNSGEFVDLQGESYAAWWANCILVPACRAAHPR